MNDEYQKVTVKAAALMVLGAIALMVGLIVGGALYALTHDNSLAWLGFLGGFGLSVDVMAGGS